MAGPNVFDNLLDALPGMLMSRGEFQTIPAERRERNQKFGRSFANPLRFDKTKVPIFFVEGGDEKDFTRTLTQLMGRKYQIYVVGCFTDASLEALHLTVRGVRDLVRQVIRPQGAIVIPNVPEIWNVELPPQTNYDTSALDPDFNWVLVEAWFWSKEQV